MRSPLWRRTAKRSPRRRWLIDVEYEELPNISDPVEALKPSAPLIHEDRSKYQNAPKLPEGMSGHNLQSHVVWKNGDIEAGFAESGADFRAHVSHAAFASRLHRALRLHRARSRRWAGRSLAANKGPWGLRDQMAEDFGVRRKRSRFTSFNVGGDFGAKASLIDVPIAYYLSKASRRKAG